MDGGHSKPRLQNGYIDFFLVSGRNICLQKILRFNSTSVLERAGIRFEGTKN